jgi:hypothetical protein
MSQYVAVFPLRFKEPVGRFSRRDGHRWVGRPKNAPMAAAIGLAGIASRMWVLTVADKRVVPLR